MPANYNGAGYLIGPGTLTTSGVTTIADYSTNAELFLGGGITWVNGGTVNDSGYGYMNPFGSDSVTIVNQAGANFDLTTDDASLVQYNNGTDTFTNAGTLAKTGGSGTSALNLAITNSGTINAASGTLQLQSTVSNTGLLLATNGGVFDLSPATLSNLTGTTLSGGSYEADAGSIIELSNNATIATDSANITLSGVGSSIQAFNGSTEVTLDSSLSSITANGALTLLNGRNFTVAANAGTLSLAGLLSLGGVKFSATKLAITGAGTASGYGTIASAVTDAGTISAAGGTLLLSGAGHRHRCPARRGRLHGRTDQGRRTDGGDFRGRHSGIERCHALHAGRRYRFDGVGRDRCRCDPFRHRHLDRQRRRRRHAGRNRRVADGRWRPDRRRARCRSPPPVCWTWPEAAVSRAPSAARAR